jgi:DNA-binding NarL/FixJ family response regulator
MLSLFLTFTYLPRGVVELYPSQIVCFMNAKKPITILVVDDHPLIRDGLAFALQTRQDMELVGEAKDGAEAIALFQKHRPDVTLMDLQMPNMNGIDAISKIRGQFPTAKFIVLTTYSGDAQAMRALKAGASGYLLKSMVRKDLIDTILAVHAGQRRIPPEIAGQIAEHVSDDDLSSRELDILRSVSAGNSNKIVASQLGIAEDTVKGHMSSIMLKLGANDRTHAVMIAIKRGFLEG